MYIKTPSPPLSEKRAKHKPEVMDLLAKEYFFEKNNQPTTLFFFIKAFPYMGVSKTIGVGPQNGWFIFGQT